MQFRQALNSFCTQAGLELTAILLPQPSECWNYTCVPPCLAIVDFLLLLSAEIILNLALSDEIGDYFEHCSSNHTHALSYPVFRITARTHLQCSPIS